MKTPSLGAVKSWLELTKVSVWSAGISTSLVAAQPFKFSKISVSMSSGIHAFFGVAQGLENVFVDLFIAGGVLGFGVSRRRLRFDYLVQEERDERGHNRQQG